MVYTREDIPERCTSRRTQQGEIKLKKLLLSLSVILLISSVSAYNFGTFTYQTSKETVDRNVSFQIGMINPENTSLDVELSAEGLENGEIVFPKNNFELDPTETSGTPAGEGWVSIGPGRYTRVEKIGFWVIMDEKVDEEFNIRIEAGETGSDDSGISPRTVQVRDYSYSIDYPGEESVRVSDGYERGEEDKNEDLEIIRPTDQENDDADRFENGTLMEDDNRSENSSKTSKTSEDPTSKEEGVSSITILLLLGTLGSLMYLWTVI